MAIGQCKDVEKNAEIVNGLEDLETPFLQDKTKDVESGEDVDENENGSLWMVMLCTFVAVCGSFAFGTCVSL